MIRYKLEKLTKQLDGKLNFDRTTRLLYATDASEYRQLPLAVAFPENNSDIKKIIAFANEEGIGIIPRGAGTSLAGQVVGRGIIIDVSKTLNHIIEINQEEGYAIVQPGVIRDDLNKALEKHKLFFAPETSTSDRCVIGGMIGNNACGTNSIVYGSTRDHIIELNVILSNGDEAAFAEIPIANISDDGNLKTNIYRTIETIISNESIVKEIQSKYPKPSIQRRNTGYALDALINKETINLSSLICGSEGTLCFISSAKVKLSPLPPQHASLLCIHFDNMYKALDANKGFGKYHAYGIELMDQYILDCTIDSPEHKNSRFFIDGNPKAIIVIELRDDNKNSLNKRIQVILNEFKTEGIGYTTTLVAEKDIAKVWSLRKAGLGLLGNIPGESKPVTMIEDTSVDIQDLPNYIKEFNQLLKKNNLSCVHYGHVGSGELHLRPFLNLKKKEDRIIYKELSKDVALLVKKYRGSLSGEHGDGRVRGVFIEEMIGSNLFEQLKSIKNAFDPHNIFNPNKIFNTREITHDLKSIKSVNHLNDKTIFSYAPFTFSESIERCNGSGECIKSLSSDSTMCPSYKVSLDEEDSTRGRANVLRELLQSPVGHDPFDQDEIRDILDRCLSCKACKSECPSGVDISKFKAEYLQHYYQKNPRELRDKLIAYLPEILQKLSSVAILYNITMRGPLRFIINAYLGLSNKRKPPKIRPRLINRWINKYKISTIQEKKVNLFIDEFTYFYEPKLVIKAMILFEELGYNVIPITNCFSGRTWISKGYLHKAKKVMTKTLNELAKTTGPIVGIEPSAILTLRDEYLDLSRGEQLKHAQRIASRTFTAEEFIHKESLKGNINSKQFSLNKVELVIHNHCHQKALSDASLTKKVLELPLKYSASTLSTGCCGMAGSFGYEAEHHELSIQIGQSQLFKHLDNTSNKLIVATGISCRQQIKDGINRKAYHPVEILTDALI